RVGSARGPTILDEDGLRGDGVETIAAVLRGRSARPDDFDPLDGRPPGPVDSNAVAARILDREVRRAEVVGRRKQRLRAGVLSRERKDRPSETRAPEGKVRRARDEGVRELEATCGQADRL